MRQKLAYLCFGLSSFLDNIGHRLGKTKKIRRGFFVLDGALCIYWYDAEKILHMHWWSMPEQWTKDMNKLKGAK